MSADFAALVPHVCSLRLPASPIQSGRASTEVTRFLLVSAIAVVLLIPIAERIIRRRFDPFEPIVIFALAYNVMFVIRPAAMIARDDLAFHGPRTRLDVSATFSEMLVLALLGAVGFVIGYELALGRRLAGRLRCLCEVDTRRVIGGATLLAGVGILAFVAFIASTGGFSTFLLLFRGTTSELEESIAETSFYIWEALLFLIPSVLIFFAFGLDRRRKMLLLAALGLTLLFLLRTVPLGTRIALLPLLGALFVFFYIRRASRPSLISFAAVAAVALLGSAFLSDLRGRGTRGETVPDTVLRATKPSRLFTPFTSGPDTEMAPALAAAIAVIPSDLHYTYGRTLIGDLVSRPVPRALWNDKPSIPRKRLIAYLWPIESARRTINPEFSALLYFYWDFGPPGIVAGLLLYGIVARLSFEYFIRHRSNLPVQVLYSLSLPFLAIAIRDGPVDTLIRVVFVVLPALLIFRVAEKRTLPIPATVPK